MILTLVLINKNTKTAVVFSNIYYNIKRGLNGFFFKYKFRNLVRVKSLPP